MYFGNVPTPNDIQQYIRGVIYPASKKDLMVLAKQNDAPPEVSRMIEHLPLDYFEDYSEIMRAFGEGNQGED